MQTILLIIHLLIAIALIGVVLLQKSEGGGLGLGGGGMSGFMTGRGAANLLTRATAVLAGLFMAMSLFLAMLVGGTGQPRSILDAPTGQAEAPLPPLPAAEQEPAAPTGGPAAAPAGAEEPAAPSGPPSVPLGQ